MLYLCHLIEEIAIICYNINDTIYNWGAIMVGKFQFVLENYLEAKLNPAKRETVRRCVTQDIVSEIEDTLRIDRKRYKVYGSIGKGPMAEIPWVAIFDRTITETATKGYYVVFLFSANMKGFYLSINQGWTYFGTMIKPTDVTNLNTLEFRERCITATTAFWQKEITVGTNLPLSSIKLSGKNKLARGYELGHIYGKYYDFNRMPTDTQFVNDLRSALNAYEALSNKYRKLGSDINSVNLEIFRLQGITWATSDSGNGVNTARIDKHPSEGTPSHTSDENNTTRIPYDFNQELNSSTNSDRPSKNDRLNRRIYADSLARLIANSETETPLTIGLFAGWGEGKSTLVELLEDRLQHINAEIHEVVDDLDEKEAVPINESLQEVCMGCIRKKCVYAKFNYKKDCETCNDLSSCREEARYCKQHRKRDYNFKETFLIKFDASEYDEHEKIWSSILKSMYSTYKKPRFAALKYILKKNKSAFMKNILVGIVIFLFGLIFYPIIVKYLDLIDVSEKVKNGLGISYGIVGTAAILIYLAYRLYKELNNDMTVKLYHKISKSLKLPDYNHILGFRDQVKRDIEVLLNAWLRPNDCQCDIKRVVLVIDELDRCSKEKIIQTLEAIQIFLGIKGLIVVLSINYELACYALADKYSFTFEKEPTNLEKIEFGMSYLQKYVNIPIYLDRNNDYGDYLDDMLKKYKKAEDETAKTQTDSSQNEHKKEEDVPLNNETVDALKVDQEPSGEDDQETNEEEEQSSDEGDYEVAAALDESKEEKLTRTKLTLEDSEIDQIKDIFNRIKKVKYINPRELKRIINMIALSKDLFIGWKDKTLHEVGHFESYINWFIFSYFNRSSSYIVLSYVDEQTSNKVLDSLTINDEILKLKNMTAEQTLFINILSGINTQEIAIYRKISSYFILYIENYQSKPQAELEGKAE